MTALALYWLFLRVVLLSFSGFATVPLLRESLVLDHGVLTDTQLNDAIAISQSSPGPLGLYVVVVGQFVAGLPGALAGVMALATPAVLAIPISWLVLRGNARTLEGACSGIVIASCGLMVVTGIRLAPQATLTPWHAALIIAGTLVLAVTKIKPVWIIAVAAVLGLMLR
jgi:chromate transporter